LAQGQQNSNPDVDIKEASPLHQVVREGCSSAQRDSKRFKISVCHDGAFMDKAYVFSQEGTRMAEGFCTPQKSNGKSYRSRSVIIPNNSSSLCWEKIFSQKTSEQGLVKGFKMYDDSFPINQFDQ
jgi:hypothetical protein